MINNYWSKFYKTKFRDKK